MPAYPALVGHRVAGLVHADFLQGQAVAVLHHYHACGNPAPEDIFHGLGHGGNGLAAADDQDAVVRRQVISAPFKKQYIVFKPEIAMNGLLGVDGGQGGMEDGQGILSQAVFVLIVGIHDEAPQLSTVLRFTFSTFT